MPRMCQIPTPSKLMCGRVSARGRARSHLAPDYWLLTSRRGGTAVSEAFVARVETGDNHVALKVKDLDQSVSFYNGIMGLPIIRKMGPVDNPRSIFVPGIQLTRQTEDPGPAPYGI